VKAVTTGYNLNSNDAEKIGTRVQEWLDNDQYIFPLRNNVSNFLWPVDFTNYLQDGAAGKVAGFR
jgi:hypothetical protein